MFVGKYKGNAKDKRSLGTDFVLVVWKMSSSNSKEFGMNNFLIGIATPQEQGHLKWSPDTSQKSPCPWSK
jgi:hypothetical protein